MKVDPKFSTCCQGSVITCQPKAWQIPRPAEFTEHNGGTVMWLSCETQFNDLGEEPEGHVGPQKAAVDTVWARDRRCFTVRHAVNLFHSIKKNHYRYLYFYTYCAGTFLGGWNPVALYLVGCCVSVGCVTHISDATSWSTRHHSTSSHRSDNSGIFLWTQALTAYQPKHTFRYVQSDLVLVLFLKYLKKGFYSRSYLCGCVCSCEYGGSELWAHGFMLRASCFIDITVSTEKSRLLTPCDDNIILTLIIFEQRVVWCELQHTS